MVAPFINHMKRILLALLCLFLISEVNAQDFVKTIDGQMFWANINPKTINEIDAIVVEKGRRNIRIPKSDIVLIEFMEDGLLILQKDKLELVEPVGFKGDIEVFFSAKKKVYVPLASSSTQQRWGAKRLRELIMEDNYWKVVGCEQEADFVLEYIFDDNGSDHAYLEVTDRLGNLVASSYSVSASDWVPVHAGEESAEKLYKKCLVKGLYRNSTKGWR